MPAVDDALTPLPDSDPSSVSDSDYALHNGRSDNPNVNDNHHNGGRANDAYVSWGPGNDNDSAVTISSPPIVGPAPPHTQPSKHVGDGLPSHANGTVINSDRTHGQSKLRKFAHALNRQWGTWFSATSAFFFSWQAVGMKSIHSIIPYEMVIFQAAIQAIPAGIILLLKRKNPVSLIIIKKSGWKLVLRGILGGAGILLRIIAVQNVAMGEVSALIFASPVIVAILSPCLLKERPSKMTLGSTVLTIAGMILVVQPELMFGQHVSSAADQVAGNKTVAERNLGLGCAVVAAGVGAGIQFTLRLLKEENEHVVMFWYGVVACAGALIVAAAADAKNSFKRPGSDWWMVLLTGVFQYMSQLFQTIAFQVGDSAAAVSIVRTTEILWAYIWQITIFKEPVNMVSLAGSVIIVSSILLVLYEKYRHTKEEERRKKVLAPQLSPSNPVG